MTYVDRFSLNPAQISVDAGGRVSVAQLTTLGDYKCLGFDKTLLLENAGTGTGTFASNQYSMSVTSGQWFVRQSKRFHPYFSGKSQMYEFTFRDFQPQANVIKRFGCFSSNAVSPFDTVYDGIWVESDGTTIKARVSRAGTLTHDVAITSWTGYNQLGDYKTVSNWNRFTVVEFRWLWLGGAVLQIWVKTETSGFVLAHSFNYAGSSGATSVMMLSPNQPVRYEIRSSTGTGSFVYVCAQCSTEGSVAEAGVPRSVNTGSTLIAMASAGTTYPLIAIRKATAFRDVSAYIDSASVFLGSTNDQILATLQVNPIVSAPLTYSAVSNSCLEQALGNGTITVTTPGTLLLSSFVSSSSSFQNAGLLNSYLSYLGGTLANSMDTYVLCVTPITSTVTVGGLMETKEF